MWIGSSAGLLIFNLANFELEAVLHYKGKVEVQVTFVYTSCKFNIFLQLPWGTDSFQVESLSLASEDQICSSLLTACRAQVPGHLCVAESGAGIWFCSALSVVVPAHPAAGAGAHPTVVLTHLPVCPGSLDAPAAPCATVCPEAPDRGPSVSCQCPLKTGPCAWTKLTACRTYPV